MKWLVLSGFVVCFLSYGDCGALNCTVDSVDSACIIEKEEKAIVANRTFIPNGQECAANTNWKSQCNDCSCSPEGNAFCTEKACIGQENERVLRCAPGSRWIRVCNTCWCTSRGRARCTLEGCDVNLDFSHSSEEVEAEKGLASPIQYLDIPEIQDKYKRNLEEPRNIVKRSVCKPSHTFQSECNTCHCASDGLSYHCTQNECIEKTDVDKEVEVFMENEGVDHIERHSVCKPGGTFYVGCNTCHCNLEGTDYSCTNKPCPLPEDVEIFHELREMKPIIPYKEEVVAKEKKGSSSNKTKKIVCAANRMFIKDCNTCWCNEDGTGYFCTRKICVPDRPEDPAVAPTDDDDDEEEGLRTIKRECRPNEVFELNCNMCRCNPDGISFSCTRRACEDPAEDIKRPNRTEQVKDKLISRKVRAFNSGPTKTCQPGLEFRMDCNTCLCNNEGSDYSCTRIDCAAQTVAVAGNARLRRKRDIMKEIQMDCVAGSVFDQGCSVCRCEADGRRAICNQRQCDKQTDAENDVNAATDTGFRCSPGEQFKRACNDCTCSADGKSVFCTLRLCESDLMPTT